jgi:hypothetical protein
MQQAAEAVCPHRQSDMAVEEADRRIDARQAPHPETVLRAIRRAVAVETEAAAQALAVARVAQGAGQAASRSEMTQKDAER